MKSVQKVKILVIGDSATLAKSITERLPGDRFAVHEANDGPSGLTATTEIQPDLIVLDQVTPARNGHEVYQALRQRPEHADIPVLVITGNEDEAIAQFGYPDNGVEFLPEQLLSEQLKERINAALATRRSRPEEHNQHSLQTTPGNGRNGSHQVVPVQRSLPTPVQGRSPAALQPFQQGVVLQQSPWWPRAIAWGIVGVTTFGVIWACLAKFEEAVSAQGKLEPKGAVIDVQAPLGGVVKAIHIEEGETVDSGDLLIGFDQTTAQAQLESLTKIRRSLLQENQFYQALLAGALTPARVSQLSGRLDVPTAYATLAENRAALVEENRYYRASLDNVNSGEGLSPRQQERLRFSQLELNSRAAAAQLEVDQLERELQQNQVQLASAREVLKINQKILNDIQPLLEEGGVARVQFLRQQQDVSTSRAEAEQLAEEQARLKLAISQARERLDNTIAQTKTDLLSEISENDKRIAEIDSQFTKAIVENNKRIAEIDSQISETKVTLQYQDLQAPVSGTVFDLQAKGPGFVVQTSEPILKLVPEDSLVARVFITNQDIGFVREGMPVDVRVDSFPFSEFGDIKGQLIHIGSDALPPNDVHPFYRFPADVELNQQYLTIADKEIDLQSGMSVSANIKIRKRTVMSIFTELFTKQVESLKSVR